MIFWLILGIYLTGWLVTAPKVARLMAVSHSYCHREFTRTDMKKYGGGWTERSTSSFGCLNWDHEQNCWRPDSDAPIGASEAAWGTVSGLVWPVLAPVALTFYLAQPRPAKAMKSEDIARKIEQAERDLGIGQSSVPPLDGLTSGGTDV